ncbi:MAG: pilus assembly protein PilP [Betaproteobacteria bacterium HGW-Betaproteobacteria-22]|nr:MAG: pilus assembly protein PilP [Betaproteobacteria bacterium HGW-Betaproteobacteria-22]
MIPVSEYMKTKLSAICYLTSSLMLATLLTACSSDQGDDLDQYMRDAAKDVQPKIQPLPEVKSYMALQYNADNMLVDPFRARKAVNKSSALQPNLNRPKEPMEAYPLESLKYVGMLSRSKLTYALVKTPDNAVQQVKVGNYVGQNFGRVTQITDSELILKETVQDDLSGDWIERESVMALQE